MPGGCSWQVSFTTGWPVGSYSTLLLAKLLESSGKAVRWGQSACVCVYAHACVSACVSRHADVFDSQAKLSQCHYFNTVFQHCHTVVVHVNITFCWTPH